MPKTATPSPSNKEIYKTLTDEIEGHKIIILLTGDNLTKVIEAAEYLKEQGHGLIGLDFRIPKIIEILKSYKRKGERNYGVFGITNPKDIRIAINSGARFVFSTHFNKAISRRCKRNNIFHASGSLTPGEVAMSREMGVDAISIYPCSGMGGVKWLKQLHRIFPNTNYIPTDVMTAEEMKGYLELAPYAVAPIIEISDTADLGRTIDPYIKS